MATVQGYINRLNSEITEIEGELAKLDPQSAIYNYAAPDLQAQIADRRWLVRQAEQSHEYRLEQTIDAEVAARREERAFMERRQQRLDRIAAAQRDYDEQVNSIDWRLVQVPYIVDRRPIVKEHLAELNKRKEQAALLNGKDADIDAFLAEHNLAPAQAASVRKHIYDKAALDFETKYTDAETGRSFVIVSDAEGTYVDSDHSTGD